MDGKRKKTETEGHGKKDSSRAGLKHFKLKEVACRDEGTHREQNLSARHLLACAV